MGTAADHEPPLVGDPPPAAGHDAPRDLGALFRAPPWLRDFGATAWLLVGLTLAAVGAVWLLAMTNTIVLPILTAGVVAAVASPVLAWLVRHRVPRGVAAALLLLGAVLAGAGVAWLVLGGITSQTAELQDDLGGAKDTIAGWLTDAGVSSATAENAKDDVSSAVNSAVPALLEGVVNVLEQLASLVFFLSLTLLSLFFLLKDGPLIRRWAERHMRVPQPVAHNITHRVLESFRGYFFGVTIVAVFNAIVVGIGAWILGVPLAGTIAAVTFVGAYVPYLGAWTAGIFSVLVALGGAGTQEALGMVVVQLLANGLLQQLVQPIAYGAALGIHPLAVLVVTIAGGSLFGAVGLILAAPLTSAATKIAADLARAREAAAAAPGDVHPTPGGL